MVDGGNTYLIVDERCIPCQGFGLSSMKERTEFSGGTFCLETGPGVGTSIKASWPLKASVHNR